MCNHGFQTTSTRTKSIRLLFGLGLVNHTPRNLWMRKASWCLVCWIRVASDQPASLFGRAPPPPPPNDLLRLPLHAIQLAHAPARRPPIYHVHQTIQVRPVSRGIGVRRLSVRKRASLSGSGALMRGTGRRGCKLPGTSDPHPRSWRSRTPRARLPRRSTRCGPGGVRETVCALRQLINYSGIEGVRVQA